MSDLTLYRDAIISLTQGCFVEIVGARCASNGSDFTIIECAEGLLKAFFSI